MLGLANVFLFCAITGYVMSIVMFFWPAYRLYGLLMLVLNVVSWRFAYDLKDLGTALAAVRFQRELERSLHELKQQFDTTSNLLNNMQQAVFVVGADGKILAPVSKFSRQIFGFDIENHDLERVLYRNAEQAAVSAALQTAFGEDEVWWTTMSETLPHLVHWASEGPDQKLKYLKVAYKPLWNEQRRVDKIMLVVEDISTLVLTEKKLNDERVANNRNIALIEQMVARSGKEVADFFAGGGELIQSSLGAISSPELGRGERGDALRAQAMRDFHTIKGNARMMGLQSISQCVHQAESDANEAIAAHAAGNGSALRMGLGRAWAEIAGEVCASAGVAERFLRLENPIERVLRSELSRVYDKVQAVFVEASPEEPLGTPLVRAQWETLGVCLRALPDTAGLASRWDAVEQALHDGQAAAVSPRWQELAAAWAALQRERAAAEAREATEGGTDQGRRALAVEVARVRLEHLHSSAKALSATGSGLSGEQLLKLVARMPEEDVAGRLQGFEHMIREIAERLGKQVSFQVKANAVTLGRRKAQSVQDGLGHLVRNALDHGIEPPEVRTRQGKPTTGRIELTAEEVEGEAVFTVVDDGAGIDVDQICRAAVDKGFIAPEKVGNLSPQEKLDLIFVSGVTTKSETTDLSGRGIGTDAARSAIEGLGGKLQVFSQLGKGTCFEIRVPLPADHLAT
jgi:two-component system chemotaxis sensor kinase CheA